MATRIKRYETQLSQLDGLLARIEAEMGPDAKLEPRRFRRGGFLGLFGGRQMIEVVAILEVDSLPEDTSPVAAVTEAAADPPPAAEPEIAAGYSPAGTVEPPTGRARRVDLTADAPLELETPPAQPGKTPEEPATPVVRAAQFPQIGMPGSGNIPLAPAGAEERIAADARKFAAGKSWEQESPEPAAALPEPQPPPKRQCVQPSAGPANEIADVATVPVPPVREAQPPAAAGQSEISELRESISELRETISLLADQQRQALGNWQQPIAGVPPVDDTTLPHGLDQTRFVEAGRNEPAAAETAAAASHLVVADPIQLDHAAALLETQRRVYDRLLDWNIGSYDALELINTALAGQTGNGSQTEDELLQFIFGEICRNILLSDGIQLPSAPPGKVVALVGATGVGKTTTIAKLAARFAFQHNARVSFVSLDNYRIAAAEQLRTYADIMGLDLNIVFSRDEFDQVLTERRACDLTLVDTAGRSPNNTRQIYELREIFSAHPPDEVHLVVSASTKADDLRMLLENFEPLSYDHVIVSKLDETRSLGCLYNLSKYSQLPISYLTVGQSVPEDIRTANLAFVRTWIEQGRIT